MAELESLNFDEWWTNIEQAFKSNNTSKKEIARKAWGAGGASYYKFRAGCIKSFKATPEIDRGYRK